MSLEPELGQMCFGNPTGEYGTPEYVDAFVLGIISEIERVYWNREQKEWDNHTDPKITGLEFRPYCWDEESEECAKPNLKFDFSRQEIRWYKYPCRGQSCTMQYTAQEWADWYEQALAVIREGARNDTT